MILSSTLIIYICIWESLGEFWLIEAIKGIMTFSILTVLNFLNRQVLPSNLVARVLSLKFMGLEGP